MKPLTDYSHIRGFCHHVDTDDVRLRRELGYAKKAGSEFHQSLAFL